MKVLVKIVCHLMLISAFLDGLAQEPLDSQIRSGRSLFRVNCGPCHDLHREKTGPMLASITKKRTKVWLKTFIRDSQQVILTGDVYANFLYQQYNQTVMPSFEELTDNEIQNILLFIEYESIYPQQSAESDRILNARGRSDILRGKVLFEQQCASCHFVDREGYGPALGSITKRRPMPWLRRFIKNSQQLIKSGDFYADHLFHQFDQRVMVRMDFLADDEIDAILSYIEYASSSPRAKAGENGRPLWPASVEHVVSISDVSRPRGEMLFRFFIALMFVVSGIMLFYLVRRLFLYLE